ncbi:MAG: hypothetical protein Q7K35_05900 [bacterium]|nr:hypothetical protein [bacterium]
MKSFPKILITLFLTVFILQMICLFFLLAAPVASQAIEFKPQVGIPNSGFENGYKFSENDSTAPIAKYIRAIYNYAIGIIGILAAVILMYGGVLWIVAGGNSSQISEAKSWIGAALTGLVLALTSYLILNTINPALVNLQISKVPGVGEFIGGCCIPPTNSTANSSIDNSTEEDCKKITGSTFVKKQTCSNVLGSCEYTKTTGGSTCRNDIKENDCRTKKGKFIARQTCPVYSCCSYSTGGFTGTLICTDTFGVFTKEDCEATAKQQNSTFINFERDGACSDTAGKGCEPR